MHKRWKDPLSVQELIFIQPIPANRLKQIATDVRRPFISAYRQPQDGRFFRRVY